MQAVAVCTITQSAVDLHPSARAHPLTISYCQIISPSQPKAARNAYHGHHQKDHGREQNRCISREHGLQSGGDHWERLEEFLQRSEVLFGFDDGLQYSFSQDRADLHVLDGFQGRVLQ